MTRQRLISGCAVLLLTVFGAAPTSAFEWIEECRNRVVWDTTTITMNVSAVDFPAGSQQRAAVERMRTAWNAESPGSRFRFNYNFVANDNFVVGDGVNNVVIATPAQWAALNLGVNANALAVAFPRYSRNDCPWLWGADPEIIEKDVIFNPTPNGNVWNFQINPPPPHPQGPFDFANVGIHEFGHVFGADHENDVLSTMDEYYENGGVIGNFNELQPHADDTLAVRAGYGTLGTARDLAASAFRRTGGGTSDPIPAPATAARNQPVNILFTIENRGTTNQNPVRVEFFASTNRFISTADTFLGAANFSMNAGALATFNVAMTIPATLAAGNYHLGWIVDSPNSIAEVDEGNNGVGLVDRTLVTANSAPNACCTASPVFGTAPLRVTFDASCSNDPDGGALTYTWDFDDGSTGTGQTTSHWFDLAGLYFVEVTVREPGGLTDTADCEVEVTCEPEEECEV